MGSNHNHTTQALNDISRIAANTKINGTIVTIADIRIDGEHTGDIITKGKLVLGEAGKVKGNITCGAADVYGECEGNIMCSNLVSFKSRAVYKGTLKTAQLGIEVGSTFSGSCSIISKEEAAKLFDEYFNNKAPEKA